MHALRIILSSMFVVFMLNTAAICAPQKPIRPLSGNETLEFIEKAQQSLLENGTILSVAGTMHNDNRVLLPLNITLSQGNTTITSEITIGDRTQEYIIDAKNNDIYTDIPEINDQFILSLSDIANLFLLQKSLHYIGPNRVSGRPVHEFSWQPQNTNDQTIFSCIKISIDTKFYVPLKVEYINNKHHTIRRIVISSFKKNGDTWMPKTITLSDFSKNQKTTINIDSYDYFMSN